MKNNDVVPARIQNPFSLGLVTELIENPRLYTRMFSEQILVSETLEVFRQNNVIVSGPLGFGKSMLLNLIRYKVLSEYFRELGQPPGSLRYLHPFLGISINLVRANFHAFGRRSVARAIGSSEEGRSLDIAAAADFLIQYLFHDFLSALKLITEPEQQAFADWLGIRISNMESLAAEIATWSCWRGYYRNCRSIDDLIQRASGRLQCWSDFQASTSLISSGILEGLIESLTTLEEPLHRMGNLLRDINSSTKNGAALYVVIDQYEELPELNQTHGAELQRVLNSLIKSRDPVVFYKIGARSHDWGQELRIWGAESKVEVRRDYVIVDLRDVLMRKEHTPQWLFPKLALDVASKRLEAEGYQTLDSKRIKSILGVWDAHRESRGYLKPDSVDKILKHDRIGDKLRTEILIVLGDEPSPLEVKLASAWVLQRLRRGKTEKELVDCLPTFPWRWKWWIKERVEVSLIQIASIANQRKHYFGWRSVLMLSGSNISAFLLIFKEVWDKAGKTTGDPLAQTGISLLLQSEGIRSAAAIWSYRDAEEALGGSRRHTVLYRLGTAIHASIKNDISLSNPGHSGFSVREEDLDGAERKRIKEFLNDGVKLGMLEERSHTSKSRSDGRRRKFYLHPLLAPYFTIPFTRVKEPLYINDLNVVEAWIFGSSAITFSAHLKSRRRPRKPT